MVPTPTIDLLSIIAITGSVQGCLLAIATWSKKKQQPARLLSMFLFLVSLQVIYSVIMHTRYIYQVPHLLGVVDPLNFIYIPLFYFYIQAIIQPTFKLRWQDSWHLLPFVWYVHKIFGLYTAPLSYKFQHLDWYYENLTDTNDWGLNLTIMGYAGVYFFFAFWKYYQFYQKNATTRNGSFKKKQVGIQWMLGGFLIIYLANVARICLAYETKYILLEGVLSAFIFYAIGYAALIKPNFLYGLQKSPTIFQDQKNKPSILLQLEQLMQNEKPYLDNQLTLSKLADVLSISPQTLSQLLNQQFQTTFFNYINRYRVEAAKQQLIKQENQQYTLEKIYKEVGFNSKSSFNTAFKKFTNLTPTQFKKGYFKQ